MKPIEEKATTHELKTWTEYFNEVESGDKPFEIRENDRDFKVNDILWLRDYDPKTKTYSGRELKKVVTYVLDTGGEFGLEKGNVCMGLKDLSQTNNTVDGEVIIKIQDELALVFNELEHLDEVELADSIKKVIDTLPNLKQLIQPSPPNEWISVDDRLPPDGEDVRVYTKHEMIGDGYHDYHIGWRVLGIGVCKDVTHWRPEVQPPTSEEQ